MRSYYLVLGVPDHESPAGIRAAYRDRVKALHPDRAGDGHEREFRELQEAYEVLSDPKRRRRYDAERASPPPARAGTTPSAPRPRPEPMVTPRHAEPIRAPGGVRESASLLGDFRTVRSSREALRERIARNFSGRGVPKSEHAEALTVELELTPDEAARGLRIPLGVPVLRICPECGGEGDTWGFPCVACDRQGVVEDEKVVAVDVPPGTRSGVVAELPLDGLGIANLFLRVAVRIVG